MSSGESRRVVVIGGGPAGLFAAERLASSGGIEVMVYEGRRSVARTLLLAGRSGLNLTHDDDTEALKRRVEDSSGLVHAALDAFGSEELRAWADSLGAETFAGSSGRVFPAAMRGAPLVRAWLARLASLDVQIRASHRWTGWTDSGAMSFDAFGESVTVDADAVVLALGGASWPRVGSDGSWAELLAAQGVTVAPLRPSNCGFIVRWSPVMLGRHEGEPIKGVRVSAAGRQASGDLTVTADGLEGTPVYSVASAHGAATGGSGSIAVDLEPDRSREQLISHLEARRRPKDSMSTWLRRAGLQPVAVDLLRDVTANSIPTDAEALAALLKGVPVPVEGLASIDRAISSAGGIDLAELTGGLMLRSVPGVFAAGEMLDWDAPTGGYLLQTCFSTGAAAAVGVLDWLADGSR